MRELLIATRNQHKMPGMIAALSGLPFSVISLNETDIPKDYSAEEPGNTYEAHAAIKAILYGKRASKLTIADDSGLEVDALSGWPGVHAATWLAGSDTDRLNGLLEKMVDIAEGHRTAQFRSTIAIYDPITDKVRFAEGITKGSILMEPKGDDPFGYNPIFFSDDLQKGFGESTFEQKFSVSHRTRALEKAKQILLKEFV